MLMLNKFSTGLKHVKFSLVLSMSDIDDSDEWWLCVTSVVCSLLWGSDYCFF